MAAAKSGNARPGGRTERNRKAVAEAVLEFMGQGRMDFEVQEISAASGVHRTTISRRWPDRGSLMAEAIAEHVAQMPLDLSGDWEADIRRITHQLLNFFQRPTELGMNRMLAISDNEAFHEKMQQHWAPVLLRFQEPLRRAKKLGLVRAELDEELVILMAASTLVVFTALTRSEPDPGLPDRIADQIIYLCRSA